MTNNKTSTIIACCIDNCNQPATVHANFEKASWYCVDHGICSGCKESVEYFVHIVDQGITASGFAWSMDVWICPCVVAGRHPAEQQRKIYEPGEVVETAKNGINEYWGKSA